MRRLLHAYTVAYSAITLSKGLFGFLADSGYVNDIVVSGHYGEIDQLRAEPGVRRVHQVAMTRRFTPRQDVHALWGIRRVIAEGGYDLVHVNSPKASLMTTLAARSLGRHRPPVLYMVRGLPLEARHGVESVLARIAERLTAELADSVVYVSPSLQRTARSYGVASRRGRVLGCGSSNGVDTALFIPPDAGQKRGARCALGLAAADLVVGFVGRLTPDKGIEHLRRFWPLVREHRPKARLLLVGEVDEDYPPSREFLRWARVEPSVTLTGHLDDVRPAYAAMDVLVLPTVREGLPNVLLEAAASGLPVMATPATGCVDVVVDGVTGWLIPDNDASRWARHLVESSTQERTKMGEAARQHVAKNFERRQVWRRLESHYTELI